MTPAFWILWATGVCLQIALLHFVVSRRLYRRTPFLAIYLIVLFITTLIDMMLYVDIGGWRRNYSAIRIYWIDDTLRQCGLLAAVLSFMFHIGRRSHREGAIIRILGTAIVAVILAGLVAYRNVLANERWTEVIRNLSFFAVLCNFFLWMRLLRNAARRDEQAPETVPKKSIEDRLLLALSAGAGIQLAGEAIGQSLRTIGFERKSTGFVTAANYLLVLAHLFCLAVWLYSLWNSRSRATERDPAPRSEDLDPLSLHPAPNR